jgi:PAS domain S-box-containing protein
MDDFLSNPAAETYTVAYQPGDLLCVEGDESQDLFILVKGRLEIMKGKQPIAEISQRGASFGEISFILGTRRTASVKAQNAVEALRIPKDDINRVLRQFPSLAMHMLKFMAQRLDEQTQSLFAFKEFCDQLPDAVLATESDGNIISWNRAAEKLYGRSWHEMQHQTLTKIFDDSDQINEVIDHMRAGRSVTERVLKIQHPEKGVRFIAVSTSMLFDNLRNFAGLLLLSRDVTEAQNLKRKYRRIRLWLIPLVAVICVGTVVGVIAYPRFSDTSRIVGIKQQALRDKIANDVLLLKSLLNAPFAAADRGAIDRQMEEFYRMQQKKKAPYIGIVLLDTSKKIFASYPMNRKEKSRYVAGSSYAGIPFQEARDSDHKILTLYRADSQHPMGKKGIEVAFDMKRDGRSIGWLVFQMDIDRLKKEFNADEATLALFRF